MDIEVELKDHMGDDLSVVNAARVSYSKKATWGWNDGMYLKDKDVKLINYLAKHNHWSPFGHASLQFRVKAPIFVAVNVSLTTTFPSLTFKTVPEPLITIEPVN